MESKKLINISSTFIYSYMKPTIHYPITILDWEMKIFKIIKETLIKYNKKTICRVAGGWVRDKVNIFNLVNW